MSVYNIFVFLPSGTPVNKHISGTGGFLLSVRPSVSANLQTALMHAKLLFPSMNVGLMQICTPLSPSSELFCPVMTKIKYIYTTMRACTQCPKLIVNVACHKYSRNGNLKLVNPYQHHQNPQLILAYFLLPTIFNQENAQAHVCDIENFYAMPIHVFFVFESLDPSMMKPYHKCDQRRLRMSLCICAISSGSRSSLTQRF